MQRLGCVIPFSHCEATIGSRGNLYNVEYWVGNDQPVWPMHGRLFPEEVATLHFVIPRLARGIQEA
ncbi:MAG: hypothetical protein AB2L12_03200 [Smithellaceae bacterium]